MYLSRSRRRSKVAASVLTAALVFAASFTAAATAQAATPACSPAWSSSAVYTGGAAVSRDGVNYTAKWWTQNNTPGTDAYGPWASAGACSSTPTPDPTPTPTPTSTPTPTPTPEPTVEPTGAPVTGNPDEKCRPDGLAGTPGLKIPYCDVYDTNGREILPNNLDRRIIGYFTSWRTGANGAPQYLASDIPWTKLSHINYAFAHIGANGKVSVNEGAAGNAATDMTWPTEPGAAMDPAYSYKGHFNLLNKFKKANPGVKTLVSVGGWAETGGYFDAAGARVADGGFYTMTESQAKIDAFADSAVAFIRTYGFDGVDIDYEYATSNSKAGNPDDFAFSDAKRATLFKNYSALMKTLRAKLDAASAADGQYYMLTVAAPASGWLLRGMEVHQVVEYLDYLNMMSYDLHGSWNEFVGGNAPLFDDGQDAELAAGGVYNAYKGIGYLNGDWAAHYFRGAMQAGRINLGVPFYTRGWQGVTGGTNGLHGKAALPDQAKCPPGTGTNIGSTAKCGNGATGIDNLWHDLGATGAEVPSGVNPIWHVLNLQKGVLPDYLPAYGSPSGPLVGSYQHNYDPVSATEWWWNPTTKVFLSGDSDQAIGAKADYVASSGLGGVMIWELAGDYDYDATAGEYTMGDTLVTKLHSTLSATTPYGASKSNTAMPTQAIDLGITFTDFALGDNNYPINPKVNFKNNSTAPIPAGSTITFDYATSTLADMGEQNGWSISQISAGHTGNNVGGLKGDFHKAQIKVPQGGIPAGGTSWAKLSWTLPIAQISNVRVTIGTTTYATTYDHLRGVTVVNPGGGTGGGGGGGTTPGTCAAPAWSASSVYTGGAKVSHAGHTWSARYWTQGNTPGASEWGPWADAGAC